MESRCRENLWPVKLDVFFVILQTGETDEEDDDDDDYDEEGLEETQLEAYETPLDADECPVDEYNIFKHVLESKLFSLKLK